MKRNFNRQKAYAWLTKGLMLQLFSLISVISFANTPPAEQGVLERKISIHVENAEVKTVLKKIEETGFVRFVYQPQVVNMSRAVSLAVEEMPIGNILNLLFDSGVAYEEMGDLVVIKPSNANAAILTAISGKITDAKTGEPLPGVNVAVKGTAQGTVTDLEGRYFLEGEGADAILVFSFVGYVSQEIPVGAQSIVDVQMVSDEKQLEEVVVVGYGTEKKGALTSSIATLQASDIIKSSSSANLSNVFAGQVPGVIANNRSGRPGKDQSTISIRGSNSFSGGTDPLYVIDGIQDRSIDRINPADIESITVLKDASAAIYGVRSANGVILVTTKRGRAGKPEITYDGSLGMQTLTRVDQRVDAWRYMTYYNELATRRGSPLQYPQTDIERHQAGNDPNYTSTNWLRSVFRQTAPQTNHSISVRGGSESVKFYISGQYLSQQSLWANSDESYKNFNIRSNLDAMITKNLKVTLDLAVRREKKLYPSRAEEDILHETVSMYPFIPVKWSNGLPSAGISYGRNPYLMTSSAPGYNATTDYFIQPRLAFDWQLPKIVEGLFLSGWAATDFNSQSQKIFVKPWDAYGYNATTNTYTNQKSSTAIPSLTQAESNFNSDTYFIKLGYERSFDKHNFNSFMGYEQIVKNSRVTSAYRRNLLSNQLDQLFTGSAVNQDATGNATQDGRESYLGRLAYSYADKYLAELTGRYNGSFNFPKDKRWGLFPSVSLGWRISEEDFIKDRFPFINRLMLRASWGTMGSDAISPYQFLPRYGLVSNLQNGHQNYSYFGPSYTETQGLYLLSSPNPNVTWEKQDTRDAGFDAVLFNNRLSITFDYFRNYRSDILAPRLASVPYYSGLTLPNENIGKSLNRGFDFIVNYSGKASAYTYHVGFNFTYAKNSIVFQDEATNIPDYQRGTDNPIGSWVVYETNGIYHTQEQVNNSTHLAGARPGDLWIIDKNGDGNITLDDQVRIPVSNVPQMVGGITMGAEYKGFALDLVWAGQTKVKQLILPQSQGSAVSPPQWLYDGRWTADNPDAPYPRAFNSGDPFNSVWADFWLRDASFVRLKSAQFSYTVPSKILKSIGINSLRLYFAASNLFSIDKMLKYQRDPETNSITGNNYPQTRVFRTGVTIGL